MSYSDRIKEIEEFIESNKCDPLIKYRRNHPPTRLSQTGISTALLFIDAIKKFEEIDIVFSMSIIGAIYDNKNYTEITFIYDKERMNHLADYFYDNYKFDQSKFDGSISSEEAVYIYQILEIPEEKWESIMDKKSFFVPKQSDAVH